VFKAGTKEKQHIVGIQPNGQGTVFQLVYVEARGDDKERRRTEATLVEVAGTQNPQRR